MSDHFQIIDFARFRPYVIGHAQLELLHTGMRWAEGPVWFGDLKCLLWSDIPNNKIMRWTEEQGVSVFRYESNHANGNTRDHAGRLVSCESGARRVTRTEFDGTITVLADNFNGKRLNSPNDVVGKSDGSIWFTDPDYGILSDYTGNKAKGEIGSCNVYRIDPQSGKLTIGTSEMSKPNGLAFSPDEKILYVADSGATHDPDGPHHIMAYRVTEQNTLSDPRVFAVIDAGVPDGFRVDVDGNVWTSAADGVHCFAPDGTLIGKLLIPETVANLTFGGAKRNRMFITAGRSLYSIFLGTRGVQRP